MSSHKEKSRGLPRVQMKEKGAYDFSKVIQALHSNEEITSSKPSEETDDPQIVREEFYFEEPTIADNDSKSGDSDTESIDVTSSTEEDVNVWSDSSDNSGTVKKWDHCYAWTDAEKLMEQKKQYINSERNVQTRCKEMERSRGLQEKAKQEQFRRKHLEFLKIRLLETIHHGRPYKNN